MTSKIAARVASRYIKGYIDNVYDVEVYLDYQEDSLEAWDEYKVLKDIKEAVQNKHAIDLYVTDRGIGSYEYWGTSGYDTDVGIDDATAEDAVIKFSFEDQSVPPLPLDKVEQIKKEFFENLPDSFSTIASESSGDDEQAGRMVRFEAKVNWQLVNVDTNNDTATYRLSGYKER
jgi:hypothetical protein